jgi:hypothetical protein
VNFSRLRPSEPLLEEPIAIGLGFLWICLAAAFGLAITKDSDSDAVLIGVVGVGFIGAAGMSGRGRWWWLYGAAAFLVLILVGPIAGWLTDTAYPPSSFERIPFTLGALYRWELFGFLLGIGLAAGIAVRSPTPSARLGRAGLAGVIAVGYLLVWDGIPLSTASAWEVVLAITLVLAAVGLGDVTTKWASLHLYEGVVAAAAVSVICLNILVLAAGIFWRLWLGSLLDLFPEPKNDMLPLGTVAAVLLGSLVLSFFIIRRYKGRTEPPPMADR